MAYQDLNLLTKTIVSSNPDEQDRKVAEFQKTNKVKFSQSHVVVNNGMLLYIIVMFYTNE